MGALNTHEEREREIEALRASISRLSAANLFERRHLLRDGWAHYLAKG